MDSLKDIISDIRIFLYGGARTLPLTLAGTMLVLGLFTANYAILFFLVGFLILAPFGAWIINFALGMIFTGKTFRARTSDMCKVNVPFSTLNSPSSVQEDIVISSAWVAMIAFFVGYIFSNAVELYSRESPNTEESDVESKIGNRKTQAIIAMASIVAFALVVFGFRYYTGCESILGMSLTSILFVFVGHGWFKALSSVGQDRLSDLFGIANRLLAPGAIQNAPIACVPIRE